MSLQPNIRGSSNSLGDQRLPVPPPLPVAPPLTKASSKAGNVQGTSSTLTIASGSVSQVVARRPSPPRRTGEEMTFQQKLDEIKRMRNRTNKNGESRMSTALLNQVRLKSSSIVISWLLVVLFRQKNSTYHFTYSSFRPNNKPLNIISSNFNSLQGEGLL